MEQQSNSRIRPVDGGPSPDVPGGDVVCVASESTRQTSENRLGYSVAPSDVPAFWTRLAGVFGINQSDQNTGHQRLIADEVTELSKRPGLMEIPLGPTNSCLADTPEVLQGDRLASVFGLPHDALGYRMVNGFDKVLFFFLQPHQVSAGIFSPPFLKSLSERGKSFSGSGNGLPALNMTIAIGSDINNPQVHAQKVVGYFDGGVFEINGNEQIPFVFDQAEIGFPKAVCQEGSLPFSAGKWNLDPTGQRGDRGQAFVYKQAKVPGVKGHTAERFECSHFLPVEFIGVGDLGRHPNRKLGRKFVGSPNLGVGYFLKAVLPEGFLFPGDSGDEVCGPVCFSERSSQSKSLVFVREQFDLNAKFHISIIDEKISSVKKSTRKEERTFLPRMNSGASCPQNL